MNGMAGFCLFPDQVCGEGAGWRNPISWSRGWKRLHIMTCCRDVCAWHGRLLPVPQIKVVFALCVSETTSSHESETFSR